MVDKILRYTLLCVCYMEDWDVSVCLVTLPSAYALGNITDRIRFAFNVAAPEELPDDDACVSKHVEAAE
jgi:hypothetical protein